MTDVPGGGETPTKIEKRTEDRVNRDRDFEAMKETVAKLDKAVLDPKGLVTRVWILWGIGAIITSLVIFLVKEHISAK